MAIHKTPDDILNFWFAEDMPSKWFLISNELDELIKIKFSSLHKDAHERKLDAWRESHEGRLALIILLDQFSRNIYRGEAEAFASDTKALEITKYALRMGDDIFFKKNRPDQWRAFLYMPLMHSENLEDQRNCVNLFQTHGPEINLPYALEHLDVIYRFGRFPGRNKALRRVSTAEEESFLMVSS